MEEGPDLFEETLKDEIVIVKVAQEAAEKRGYATYEDYNEYVRQKICHRGLGTKYDEGGFPFPTIWVRLAVKETLATNGWTFSWGKRRGKRERRFYPPGTE